MFFPGRARVLHFLIRPLDKRGIQEKSEDDGAITPKASSLRERKSHGTETRKLRPDMIRRMDDAPKLVNPSGWISEGHTDPVRIIRVEPVPEEQMTSPHTDGSGRQLAFADNVIACDPEQTETASSSCSSGTAEDRDGGSLPRCVLSICCSSSI